MNERYTIPILLALLVPASACDRGAPGELDGGGEAVSVQVSEPVTIEGATQVPARIVARETAELATRSSGTIEAIAVDVGESVRSGQVLVRLEAAGVESAIARAEAGVTVARRTYERMSNLERDGAATRQELDEAEAALRSAEAALAEARAARGYVALRAPFAGTVTARHADPGDLAVPGRPVLTVAGARGVKIESDLPAELAENVRAGDPVWIVRSGSGDRWPARVTRVVPVIELASRRFRVEAEFDEAVEAPPAGTFARLELQSVGAASPWIPADAVVRRGQLTGVFVVVDDALRLRWVRTGRRTTDAVEILAGLPGVVPVVRNPGPALLDGTPVESVSREAWGLAPEGSR